MPISRFSSGGPWEARVGYSRAVRAGDHVWVAGCTGVDATGAVVGDDDLRAQLRQTIANAAPARTLAGATLPDVVRTRIYVTDIASWEDAARAHGEAFGQVLPACTFLGVAALVNPEMLVEIDADAVVEE